MDKNRLIICLVLSIAICTAYAARKKKRTVSLSPQFTEWVNEYIALELDGDDSAQPFTKIKNHYNVLPSAEKDKARLALENIVMELSKDNAYFSVITATHLYDQLITDMKKRTPLISFAKGYASVAAMQDTIMAKQAVDELHLYTGTQTYIDILEQKIEKIRRFIPTDKGVEGYWVSDILRNAGGRGFNFYIPKYLITAKEEKGKSVFTIETQSPFISHDCITTKSDYYLAKPQASQDIRAFTKDSLYIAWSSAKLTNYDADMVGLSRELTRNAAAQATGSLAQRNKHSYAESLLGGLAVSAAEAGINALIDSWTTPSKKLYLLEAWLKRVNSHEYSGEMMYLQAKAKEGQTPVEKRTVEKLSLLRWTPESGVIFMTYRGEPITPYETSYYTTEKQKQRIEKQKQKNRKNAGKKPPVKVDTLKPYWKDVRDNADTEYGQAYLQYKQSKDKATFITNWNKKQMEKLRSYNASHGYFY